MTIKDKKMRPCPLCGGKSLKRLYNIDDLPIFQNKVFNSEELAMDTTLGKVELAKCNTCGFVFNSAFDSSTMKYDKEYQNEQNYSLYFKEYLQTIVELLSLRFSKTDSVVEIGCGKGYFLNLLSSNGFTNVIGFDPAYEGDTKNIIKDYYSSKYKNLKAKLIVLRHTLEHIESPFDFLHEIAKANNYEGKIYIEVPCFDWILEKNSFWDVFYEHCNYYTKETLGKMFFESEVGHLFNGQYIYMIADLKKIKNKIAKKTLNYHYLDKYQDTIKKYKCAVWGAGAKGVTFLNLLDPNKKCIKYVVDINPKKENKYVGKTAHKIISVESLKKLVDKEKVEIIFIMNENYKEEVQKEMNGYNVKYIILGEQNK